MVLHSHIAYYMAEDSLMLLHMHIALQEAALATTV